MLLIVALHPWNERAICHFTENLQNKYLGLSKRTSFERAVRARKILLKWNWSHASRGHSRENKKELTSAKIQCTQLSAVSNPWPQDVKTRFLGELIVYPCSVVRR